MRSTGDRAGRAVAGPGPPCLRPDRRSAEGDRGPDGPLAQGQARGTGGTARRRGQGGAAADQQRHHATVQDADGDQRHQFRHDTRNVRDVLEKRLQRTGLRCHRGSGTHLQQEQRRPQPRPAVGQAGQVDRGPEEGSARDG